MRKHKAICVGAGPAGCFTAETLKRKYPDLEVYLFERLSSVGKRACGEALGRENLENLGIQLPTSCIARNTEKILVRLGTEEKLRKIPGYMIDRGGFNEFFAQRARTAGCIVKTNYQVTGVRRTNDLWKVEYLDMNNGTIGFDTCDLLIGADGSSSSIAMYTGVVTREERRKWMREHVYGFQYKLKTPHQDEELLFDFTPIPNPSVKYYYRFYHHRDLTNVGIIFDSKSKLAYEEPHQLLRKFIERIGIEKYKIIKKVAGQIPGGGPLPKTYGDGVMIVGDAAGQTNPIFYGGITPALICGKIAGEVGALAYETGDLSEKTLGEYEKRWRGLPLGDPVLLKGKSVLEKIRRGLSVSEEELNVYSTALDNTRYSW